MVYEYINVLINELNTFLYIKTHKMKTLVKVNYLLYVYFINE